MDDEEELGVGDDALVEQAVHVAVEEGVEDARDGGVGGEEGGEEDGGNDLGGGAIEVGVVATAAVAECLANLMQVPEKGVCLQSKKNRILEVFSLHGVHILSAQGLFH